MSEAPPRPPESSDTTGTSVGRSWGVPTPRRVGGTGTVGWDRDGRVHHCTSHPRRATSFNHNLGGPPWARSDPPWTTPPPSLRHTQTVIAPTDGSVFRGEREVSGTERRVQVDTGGGGSVGPERKGPLGVPSATVVNRGVDGPGKEEGRDPRLTGPGLGGEGPDPGWIIQDGSPRTPPRSRPGTSTRRDW